MPTFGQVRADLMPIILMNVDDHTISEDDVSPILRDLAKVTQNRPLDSWKQLLHHEIEKHETGHATPKSTNVKKNNKNSCPYPAQYRHAEACTAYHKALQQQKTIPVAMREMYNAAAAAAGGGKTRRAKNKKTRKAKRRA